MKAFVLSLLFALALAVPAAAQTPVRPDQHLAWDHSGTDVVKFQLGVDGVFADVAGGAAVRDVAFPAMTPGEHTVVVKTCYDAACTTPESLDSADFLIRLRVLVAANNLRVIDAPPLPE